MEPKQIDRVIFALKCSAESFRKFGEVLEQAAAAFAKAAPRLARESLDLYRGQWWQRGEGEPEYLADLPESEWWNEGEQPPDYFIGA